MKFLNSIEKIVRHLPCLDEDLAHAAQAIEAKLQGTHDPHAVQEERDVLVARVRLRYSEFEMTAADAQCNRLNESGLWANLDRVGQGADRFRLAIDHAGADIRYVPDGKQVTAHVFAHYNLKSGRAVVLMVSGPFGASVTNTADRIIPFIQRQHIGRRGIRWKDVTWVYRDTDKAWDRIIVTDFDGGKYASVGFEPLGERAERDALEAVAEAGIVLDGHDRAHIRRVL